MVEAGADGFFEHRFCSRFERQIDADGRFFTVNDVCEVADVRNVDVSALPKR